MAAVVTRTADRSTPRGRTSRQDDLVTALLGCWTAAGLYLDGWAHNNWPRLETFITPWNAALYSGFFCLAAWVIYLVQRERRPGSPLWQQLPLGYDWALAGVLVFAAAGVCDSIWHALFGIERSIEALLSPPHLVLLAGGALLAAAPLRAAWLDEGSDARPRFLAFLPALLSLLCLSLSGSFFLQYLSAFVSKEPALLHPDRFNAALADASRINGIAAIVITNLVVVAPIVLILRRWRPPFGTVTLLFGVSAILVNALHEFAEGPVILTSLAAGVGVDLLMVRWQVDPFRVGVQRLVACTASLLLWSGYFLALQLAYGVVWDAQLWLGTIVLAMLCTFALSYLVTVPTPTTATEPPGSAFADPASERLRG